MGKRTVSDRCAIVRVVNAPAIVGFVVYKQAVSHSYFLIVRTDPTSFMLGGVLNKLTTDHRQHPLVAEYPAPVSAGNVSKEQ